MAQQFKHLKPNTVRRLLDLLEYRRSYEIQNFCDIIRELNGDVNGLVIAPISKTELEFEGERLEFKPVA